MNHEAVSRSDALVIETDLKHHHMWSEVDIIELQHKRRSQRTHSESGDPNLRSCEPSGLSGSGEPLLAVVGRAPASFQPDGAGAEDTEGLSGSAEPGDGKNWVVPMILSGTTSVKELDDYFESIAGYLSTIVPLKPGSHYWDLRPSRVLLGIISNDGTVVYYIARDGVVKPRKN